MTAMPTDALVVDVIRAQMDDRLSRRAALKGIPGTHAEQDRLLAQAGELFDQLVDIRSK